MDGQTDRQTDRQTDNSDFTAPSVGRESNKDNIISILEAV